MGIDEPSEVIYVGNSIEKDIVGANRMGLVSVLYDPKKKIKIDKLTGEEKPNFVIKRISEVIKIVGIKQKRKTL